MSLSCRSGATPTLDLVLLDDPLEALPSCLENAVYAAPPLAWRPVFCLMFRGLPEITRPLRTHLALKGRTHSLSLPLICLDGESPPLSLHLTSAQEDSMRFNLC